MDWVKLTNSGKNLEVYSTSYFQTMDYFVDTNLKWLEDKEDGNGKVDILELDILGKLFNNNSMMTILAECKKGCNFNDLFKFIGITRKVNADRNILICQSHLEKDIIKTGTGLGVEVTPPQVIEQIIISNSLTELFMFYYESNIISNKLFEKEIIKSIIAPSRKLTLNEIEAYNLIRKHLTILIGEVWKTFDLVEQAKLIKHLIDTYKDFVRTIARKLEIKPGNMKSEFYMRKHPLCQAAGYLMLKDRISYIICAVECAIQNASGKCLKIEIDSDPNFYEIVQELSKNIKLASLIPSFIQGLVYIFGGVISNINDDLKNISTYLKINYDDTVKIINLLKRLFELSEIHIQWGFVQDIGTLSIKYVPYPLKGLGMMNREQLGYSTSGFAFKEEWVNSINVYN